MSVPRTELHFHLLPDIDDGPRDEGDALALARAAIEDGTARVVLTPHVRMVDFSELGDRVQRLRALLDRNAIALEVQAGGELAPDDVARLTDAELELIAHGPAGRRWVLLEAPLGFSRPGLDIASAELRRRGFQALLGHPERSPQLEPAQLSALMAAGAMVQINASSLLGRHGARPQRTALELVGSGMPFVLASDAHSVSRPPMLTAGALALERAGLDPATVGFAVDTGPAELLAEGLSLSEPFSLNARNPAPAAAPVHPGPAAR